MASFARRWSPAAAWSVDDASTFAAQKEFKLLQLLSTDKKALATARRLGFFQQQPQPPGKASAAQAGSAASCPPGAGAAPASAGPNARKRKSAARSARRHASRRARNRWNRCLTAVLCMVRLQRRVRGRVLQQDLADINTLSDGSGAGSPAQLSSLVVSGLAGPKRHERPDSTASSSHSSYAASSSDELMGNVYHGSCRAAPAKQLRVDAPLPPGWQVGVDHTSGRPYYCDGYRSQWDHPGANYRCHQ
jgi:hypothetical protein